MISRKKALGPASLRGGPTSFDVTLDFHGPESGKGANRGGQATVWQNGSSELLTNAKIVQERLVKAKLRASVDDGDRCRQNLPPRRAYRGQR